MLVLSVVTWLATAGPQTASAYYICHSGHLPHLKLLAEAPKARRAAAMGAASCACVQLRELVTSGEEALATKKCLLTSMLMEIV